MNEPDDGKAVISVDMDLCLGRGGGGRGWRNLQKARDRPCPYTQSVVDVDLKVDSKYFRKCPPEAYSNSTEQSSPAGSDYSLCERQLQDRNEIYIPCDSAYTPFPSDLIDTHPPPPPVRNNCCSSSPSPPCLHLRLLPHRDSARR